jgi:hypothetical protein
VSSSERVCVSLSRLDGKAVAGKGVLFDDVPDLELETSIVAFHAASGWLGQGLITTT